MSSSSLFLSRPPHRSLSSRPSPLPLHFLPSAKPLALSRPLNPNRRRRRLTPLAVNLAAGDHGGPSQRLDFSGALDRARKVFDDLPPPVKTFPWAAALANLLRTVLDLAVAVAKWLAVPVLALTQLSEMSYCAHQRKMVVIPVPFLVGFAVAGVMKDTAAELASDLKEGDFPWHLLLIAAFFTLLKLPGPYYPYWGRLLIPHFANGALWNTVWVAFRWYRGKQT